jgi:hypothetical protein
MRRRAVERRPPTGTQIRAWYPRAFGCDGSWMRFLVLASCMLTAAACGNDVASYSDPVGLVLQVSSGDVDGDVLADEKNINTESGNPYGAFLAAAEAELGRSPSEITVDEATVELDAGATNVDGLGSVFVGDVALRFLVSTTDTAHTVAVRTFDGGEDAGPVAFDVTFDSDALSDADYSELASGSFKVEITGPAAQDFATANADANLLVTLTFTAYE